MAIPSGVATTVVWQVDEPGISIGAGVGSPFVRSDRSSRLRLRIRKGHPLSNLLGRKNHVDRPVDASLYLPGFGRELMRVSFKMKKPGTLDVLAELQELPFDRTA